MIAGSVFDPKTSTSVATTWVSGDGSGWERNDVRPGSSDISESFAAMVRTGDGTGWPSGWVGDGEASDAAVWRQGGDGWERVDDGEDMGGEHEQWAFDVAASDAGVLVAGGENAWGEVRPRLWFSPDGEDVHESSTAAPAACSNATGQESVREVAAVDGGFVAVGSRTADNDQDGVVWFSADGNSWEEVEAPMLGGGRQAVLTLVDAGGTSSWPAATPAPGRQTTRGLALAGRAELGRRPHAPPRLRPRRPRPGLTVRRSPSTTRG